MGRRGKGVPHAFHIIIELGEDFQELHSDFTEENSDNHIITPATIYVKTVIPAKAGIQNGSGCRIKSGMTVDMFNCRSNKFVQLALFGPVIQQFRGNLRNLWIKCSIFVKISSKFKILYCTISNYVVLYSG